MRIVLVLSGLGAGGAERVVSLLAGHWAGAGHDVAIISFDAPGDPVFHPVDPAVRIVRLGIPAGAGTARRILALRRRLRRKRPHVVISFLYKINIITLLATRGLGMPVAVAERNHPSRQEGHRLWHWLRSSTYPWADLVILQTARSAGALPARARTKSLVIPNPVTRHPRNPEPDGMKILAAVGRLDRQKGFDLLLEAFARVAPRHPDWRLMIWGEGPERPALEAQREALGLAAKVELPGLSGGPADWIGRASAFVLSSRFEGFPNALAEAMAAGLPVVAANCQFGVAEMITPGADGLLVAAEEPAAIADALDSLLGDAGLRNRLGSAAAESANRFSKERILREWDKLLPLLTD